MGKPKAPASPDYAAAATAQGEANKDAAVASGKMNNPNVINPYGTQTVTYGQENVLNQDAYDRAMRQFQRGERGQPTKDEFSSMQEGATPTITQTLSPEQQALYNKSTQAQGLLGDLSIQGAQALQGVVGKELDLSSAPSAPGSYEGTRKSVMDAMMGRANEDYGQQTEQANSSLIAAGIRPGTKAYDDKMQQIERSRNDARSQAEIQGGNAASQAYTMDSQRRQQAISEILAQRQTPLNEINALMSGSQVQNPFSMPSYAQNTNIAPAPVFGATQAQGAWDQNQFAQNMGSYNNMISGAATLGGAGLMAMSDIRLKSNVKKIGNHPLGIGIYEYDIFGKRDVGVMAQDVLTVKPEAVAVHPSGYLMVNYGAL